MRVVSGFDPTASISGTIDIGAANANQKILVHNESTLVIELDFLNGQTTLIHPWIANVWTLQDPTPQLLWKVYDGLSSANSPMGLFTVILYDVDEPVEGSYPMSLSSRLTNIGNSVTVAGLTNVQNDGYVAGTSVVEATQQNSSGSNIVINNDGTVAIAEYVSNTLTKLFRIIPGSQLFLGATARLVEIVGNFKVDGTSTFTGAVTAPNAGNSIVASSVPATGVTSGQFGSGVTIVGTAVSGAVASATTATTATTATSASSVPATGVTAGNLPSGVIVTSTPANATSAANLGGEFTAVDDSTNVLARLVTPSNRGFAVRSNDGTSNHDTTIVDKSGNVLLTIPTANIANGSLGSGVLLTSSIAGSQVSSAVANATNAANVPASGVAAGSLGSSVIVTSTPANATTAVNQSGGTVNATTGAFSGAITNTLASGTAITTTADIKDNGNFILNKNFYLLNTSAVQRLFATINSSDNNTHIYANADNGNLIITKSDGTTTQITVNDTTGMTLAAALIANGAATFNKEITNNGVHLTGNAPTSGTYDIYSVSNGAFKQVYIHFNAYVQNTTTVQTIALPTAFVEGADIRTSNVPTFNLFASGVAQTFQIITTWAAAGGTITSQTTMNGYSYAHIGGTPFDSISFPISQGTTAHSGTIIIEGR